MADATAYERITNALEHHGSRIKPRGDRQVMAQCPAHDDNNPSLSVTGTDGHTLVSCWAGCETQDVLDALNLATRDLFDTRRGVDYHYDDGRTVRRSPNKEFRQSGNTRGTPILYRRDRVCRAVENGDMVYVVEGEKDVHALETLGVTATCAPMGAGKAHKTDWSPLADATVVVVPDADDAGQKHAEQVQNILDGHGATVTVAQPAAGKDAADHVAAGHEIADLEVLPRYSPQGEKHSNSLYADVAALLDGGLPDPPAPVLLRRNDGHALFYAAQVNILFGDPESGKTLVAQAAAAEALAAGRRVLLVDIDHNGLDATVWRLLDMGAPEHALRDPHLFRYVEPEDATHLRAVVQDCEQWKPAVAVVDSIGELLPLLGLNSNNPDDYTLANTNALKPLAQAGAAVVGIDHLAKNTDSRASGQTGTMAKRRAAGGVSLRVTVNDPFTPDVGGSAYLSINKDRHGGLRRVCPTDGKEPAAGVFTLDSANGDMQWSVTAPENGDTAKAAGLSPGEKAKLQALNPPPKSVRDLRVRVGCSMARAGELMKLWRSGSVTSNTETGFGDDRYPVTHSGVGNTETSENEPLCCDGTPGPKCQLCPHSSNYRKAKTPA